MKVALATTLAAVLLLGGLTQPAQAWRPVPEGKDTRHCATWWEMRQLWIGMTRKEVHRVLDVGGWEVDPDSFSALQDQFGASHPRHNQVRQYKTCPEMRPDGLWVEFDTRRDRVTQYLWQ